MLCYSNCMADDITIKVYSQVEEEPESQSELFVAVNRYWDNQEASESSCVDVDL